MQGLRFVEVPGDHLEPTLCRRDYVLVAATSRYLGEGYYLVGNEAEGTAVYDCSITGTRAEPRIRLGCHLRFYTPQLVTKAEFERLVIGKVAMTCRVQNRDLIQRHALAA